MTDYIVAIDLGTSHLTGVVGEKNEDGTFTIVACETEAPLSCMSRGAIRNLDDTARHIEQLVKKLESRLGGGYIDKIYAGVGGQSLRVVEHIEAKDIVDGAPVGKEDIDALKDRCKRYKPDLLEVLDIVPPVYYLDGRRETNPAGIPCQRFEAHFKLVTGRASIRRDIQNTVHARAKKEIAGVVVSPLALAEAMLGNEEKELGCALIDFGAGVTTVTIYKNGDLLHLSVIPLGGNLITRDIATLQLTEAEAEKLKIRYGSAILQKEDDDKTVKISMESGEWEIGTNTLNAIVEARALEIVENVYARISETIDLKLLGAGIVLAGGGAELQKLPELIAEKCKVKVRHSTIRDGLVRELDDMIGNPTYMTAISVMLQGSEQCVTRPVVKQPEIVIDNVNNTENNDKRNDSSRRESIKDKPRKPKNDKGSLLKRIGSLFEED